MTSRVPVQVRLRQDTIDRCDALAAGRVSINTDETVTRSDIIRIALAGYFAEAVRDCRPPIGHGPTPVRINGKQRCTRCGVDLDAP